MRRIALICVLLLVPAAWLATTAGADDSHTYEIEMYNAFGIVTGSDVRIAGVNAGTVTDLDITPQKRAVVTVELSGELGTLGKDTKCSTEPQSLIAEYFISCEPAGPPLDDGGTIPADHVSQTVQNDLVQNTLRMPYVQRLQLLINEFGTALAGNPQELNKAIELGAPAITQLRKITKLLASQNDIITNLNVNSDRVITKLASRKQDVVRFIKEARETADASNARRDDLSADFAQLDDFLAELRPTLAKLDQAARANTPLLRDLRAAAPGLNRLAVNLPGFSGATQVSLDSLGEAATVGTTALRRGRDEIRQLAKTGRKAPQTSEILADFLRDIDDPRRAVSIDDRVPEDINRTDPRAGRRDTKGYTGLEGILNYAYYQAGATNQFDQIGHLLHFTLYDIYTGACGRFSTGRDPLTGAPGVPAQDGGTTTNILDAADCVGWLGPSQPGLNEDLGLPPYDPSVCPTGTFPAAAESLCDSRASPIPRRKPGGSSQAGPGAGRAQAGGQGTAASTQAPPAPTGPDAGPTDQGAGGGGGNILDQILDGAPQSLDDLPPELQDQLQTDPNQVGQSSGASAPSASPGATQDLLDFLFSG